MGTAPFTHVTVHSTSALHIGGGVTTQGPGDVVAELGAGDVLELVSDVYHFSCADICQPPDDEDFTGSIVEADQPVAVFGGHDHGGINPSGGQSHVEEQLFPSNTIGKHYVVSQSSAVFPANYLRVVSESDDNVITITPSSVMPPLELAKGHFVDILQLGDMELQGTGPFLVTQFLAVGGPNGWDPIDDPMDIGNTSMGLEVPVEDWRSDYQFLAPDADSLFRTFLNIVAEHGAVLEMNEQNNCNGFCPLPGPPPTQFGNYDVYRLEISDNTGPHEIRSVVNPGQPSPNFAVKVYGAGRGTAYMYPAGLDLRPLPAG